MINGVSYFEDREIELEGFNYKISGRVDYRYARNEASIFVDLECESVEIESVTKFNEDGVVGYTDEDVKNIKDLVEETFEDYIDECEPAERW